MQRVVGKKIKGRGGNWHVLCCVSSLPPGVKSNGLEIGKKIKCEKKKKFDDLTLLVVPKDKM